MTISPDLVGVVSAVEILSPFRCRVVDEEFTAPEPGAPAPGEAGTGPESAAASRAAENAAGRPTHAVRLEEPAPAREAHLAADEPPLVGLLEHVLYGRLYTRAGRQAMAFNPADDRDFVGRLSAANTGRGTFEPGWRVAFVDDDGRIAVEKDGLTLFAPPQWFRPDAGNVAPGQVGRLRIGKELRHLVPGFYFAIGDGGADEPDAQAGPVVRLYWHLQSSSAARVVHAVTSELNRVGVPFRMKVLSDPGSYVRADSGVLYLGKRHYLAARAAIARAYFLVRSGLRPAVPLFTKPLAPGLGLAEDPGGDGQTSFGQHRCRLVARALWRCYAEERSSLDDRLEAVAAAFVERGLDPARPYLSAGSRDDYAPIARKGARRRIPS
jgi:hypothetical protein